MAGRADGLNDIFDENVTVKKNLNINSGQVNKTPTNDLDITNKKYVDDNGGGTTDHTLLSNIGTNTHAQIDTHIADTSIHFSNLSSFDTDDLTEGTNLYFTDARAVSAVSSADDYLKNDGDTATGNYNFDSGTLYVDATNNMVGIGTTGPYYDLDIIGQMHSTQGRIITNSFHQTLGATENDLFKLLSSSIPNTYDEIIVSGGFSYDGHVITVSKAKRTSSDTIAIYGSNFAGSSSVYTLRKGETTTISGSLAW